MEGYVCWSVDCLVMVPDLLLPEDGTLPAEAGALNLAERPVQVLGGLSPAIGAAHEGDYDLLVGGGDE